MARGNTSPLPALFLLAAAALVAALVYGSLDFADHARKHSAQQWNAINIAHYFDCHPDKVQMVEQSNGWQKHFCQINKDKGLLLIVTMTGVVITGFLAGIKYCTRRR